MWSHKSFEVCPERDRRRCRWLVSGRLYMYVYLCVFLIALICRVSPAMGATAGSGREASLAADQPEQNRRHPPFKSSAKQRGGERRLTSNIFSRSSITKKGTAAGKDKRCRRVAKKECRICRSDYKTRAASGKCPGKNGKEKRKSCRKPFNSCTSRIPELLFESRCGEEESETAWKNQTRCSSPVRDVAFFNLENLRTPTPKSRTAFDKCSGQNWIVERGNGARRRPRASQAFQIKLEIGLVNFCQTGKEDKSAILKELHSQISSALISSKCTAYVKAYSIDIALKVAPNCGSRGRTEGKRRLQQDENVCNFASDDITTVTVVFSGQASNTSLIPVKIPIKSSGTRRLVLRDVSHSHSVDIGRSAQGIRATTRDGYKDDGTEKDERRGEEERRLNEECCDGRLEDIGIVGGTEGAGCYIVERNGEEASESPSGSPSKAPSSVPSATASDGPSAKPSGSPSDHPSTNPTISHQPTVSPEPSSSPSYSEPPTTSPKPSPTPSTSPTAVPSSAPSGIPSMIPSRSPSSHPSVNPSSEPTATPSLQPSAYPSANPSTAPSDIPSARPSDVPSSEPSASPSSAPSGPPSLGPSSGPSASPSLTPSVLPSSEPTNTPSTSPSSMPTLMPSSVPTPALSDAPSSSPSVSSAPSISSAPSVSAMPTTELKGLKARLEVSEQQRNAETQARIAEQKNETEAKIDQLNKLIEELKAQIESALQPTGSPSTQPSESPSVVPSTDPSAGPSDRPSDIPSNSPEANPSESPTFDPSDIPSNVPSLLPSRNPSSSPSLVPSSKPSSFPTKFPSFGPSLEPSSQPSVIPSSSPSSSPSSQPSETPSSRPSAGPSLGPTVQPSGVPSKVPSDMPSLEPSSSPSTSPSFSPTTFSPTFSATLDGTELPTSPSFSPTTFSPTFSATLDGTELPTFLDSSVSSDFSEPPTNSPADDATSVTPNITGCLASSTCVGTFPDLIQYENPLFLSQLHIKICGGANITVDRQIRLSSESIVICCGGTDECTLRSNGTDRILLANASSFVADGITFIGGTATSPEQFDTILPSFYYFSFYDYRYSGGNVAITLGGSGRIGTVLLRNCEFHNGYTPGFGGNMFITVPSGGTITLEGCAFIGGKASSGGGLALAGGARSADIFINDTSFHGNAASLSTSTGEGGGLYYHTAFFEYFDDGFPAVNSSITILQSEFSENRAGHGGGLACVANLVEYGEAPIGHQDGLTSRMSLQKTTFRSNYATDAGGGAYIFGAKNLTIDQSNFIGNRGFYGGGVIATQLGELPNLTLLNSVYEDNQGGAAHIFLYEQAANMRIAGNSGTNNTELRPFTSYDGYCEGFNFFLSSSNCCLPEDVAAFGSSLEVCEFSEFI